MSQDQQQHLAALRPIVFGAEGRSVVAFDHANDGLDLPALAVRLFVEGGKQGRGQAVICYIVRSGHGSLAHEMAHSHAKCSRRGYRSHGLAGGRFRFLHSWGRCPHTPGIYGFGPEAWSWEKATSR